MLRLVGILAVLSSAAALAAPPSAPAVPEFIAAAVADPHRPDTDRQHDANRKPGQTLALAGVRPGETIAELLPGGGYFTRLLSKAVGAQGRIYGLVPAPVPTAPADAPDFAARVKALAAEPDYANVHVVVEPFGDLRTPEPVDLVWTSQNYHDLHNLPGLDVGIFNQLVFDMLKPGGTYFVLDHAAQAGSGLRDTASLHRIDASTVKAEVLAAGFEFVGESDLLHHPADPRTAKVFDPNVRGRTDQFILIFRRPAPPAGGGDGR